MNASCFTQKFWLILQLYKYLNVRVCTVRIIDKKIKQNADCSWHEWSRSKGGWFLTTNPTLLEVVFGVPSHASSVFHSILCCCFIFNISWLEVVFGVPSHASQEILNIKQQHNMEWNITVLILLLLADTSSTTKKICLKEATIVAKS
jgi:hypothetical protein